MPKIKMVALCLLKFNEAFKHSVGVDPDRVGLIPKRRKRTNTKSPKKQKDRSNTG